MLSVENNASKKSMCVEKNGVCAHSSDTISFEELREKSHSTCLTVKDNNLRMNNDQNLSSEECAT